MKTEREQAIQNLMKMMPDHTDSAFIVKQEGDDSGKYICVYVERTETGEHVCKRPSQHLLRDGEWYTFRVQMDYIKTYIGET